MRHQWAFVAVLVAFCLLGSRTLWAQHAGNGKFILGPIRITVVEPAGGPAAGSEVVLIGEKQDPDPVVLGKTVEGTVVDKTGTPVAGAEIRIQSADKLDTSFLFNAVFGDAAGKFTIDGAREKQQLNVRARTKRAVSEPMNITVGESPDPLRLVVDETTSFTLRGTVVDDTGNPLPGVDVCPNVELWFDDLNGRWMISYQAAPVTVQTDADGRFEIGGLWAGDKYGIQIDAKGFKTFGSKKIAGTPGGVHDFGRITLVATNLIVAGRVVDSAGAPVADVRVFNNGDGPEPITTRSNVAGEFQLKGFPNGPLYVFADKEGWRFTGLRANAGAQDVVLVMLRAGERVSQAPAPTVPDAAEEEKAARDLLELLWEKSSSEGAQRRRVLIKLAKVDRQLARQRAQENNIDLDNPLDRDRLRGIAVENLDAALGLIAKQKSLGYYLLKDLANRFAISAPEKATRCVEAAVLQARSLGQPQRAIGLAEMGALTARLGNEESGRKLVLEAAEMAAQWTPSAQVDRARGTVAAALARFDLPRALALLENVGQDARNRGLANVAASLDDVQQAESLLKDVESSYARQARWRLAYRIAAARPAEAVALIEKAPVETAPAERGYGIDEDTRAIAFGWLATQIAPSDATLAHRLIDRAFATYLLPGVQVDRFWGARAVQPALLAVQAQQAGYPDMESVVWRVLATRATTPRGESPAAAHESQAITALWLALVDRSVAQQILAAVEPNSDVIGTRDIVQGRREWLRAWALVDPHHAVGLARRDLEAAKDDVAKRLALRAIDDLIDLWTTPADNRLSYLVTPYEYLSPVQEY